MGQYFRGIILTKKNTFKNALISYDYHCGAKLLEHSHIGNTFVESFERLIDRDNGKFAGLPILWAGDYAEYPNMYDFVDYFPKKQIRNSTPLYRRYIINETTNEYIDKEKMKCGIDPLPIMCVDSHMHYCGDYFGYGNEYAGKWARNVITVADYIPDGYKEYTNAYQFEF